MAPPKVNLDLRSPEKLAKSLMHRFQDFRITKGKSAAPTLMGHHPPSKKQRSELLPVTFSELELNQHHTGKILYAHIAFVTTGDGMAIAVQDKNNKRDTVWSLIAYPLPRGEATMSSGSVTAVKEPYYSVSVCDTPAIIVHHPTDLEHVSKFDIAANDLITPLPPNYDFVKAERLAFAEGKMMEVVDICSAALERSIGSPAGWYLKRAAAFARVGMRREAYENALKHMPPEPAKPDRRALKIMCEYALEFGNYEAAASTSQTLRSMAPDHKVTQNLTAKVSLHTAQSKGDFDLGQLAEVTTTTNMLHSISGFTSNVEILESHLHGYGLFSKKALRRGEIVMWERAFALSVDADVTSFTDGLHGLLPTSSTAYTNRHELAFLQELCARVHTDPGATSRLYEIWDQLPDSEIPPEDVVDIYRIMRVVIGNYHEVTRGSSSLDLDFYDGNLRNRPAQGFGKLKLSTVEDLAARGLWHRTCFLNHSCHSNVTPSHIGNVMVIIAQRDISEGDELTMSYAYDNPSIPIASWRHRCPCKLCNLERLLEPADRTARADLYSMRLGLSSRFETLEISPQQLAIHQDALAKVLTTYERELQARLPCTGLLESLFRLGQASLGHVEHWSSKSVARLDMGRNYFLMMLALGLRLYLVPDPAHPGYCLLKYGEHAMSSPFGVLALVCLAELACVPSIAGTGPYDPLQMLRCAKTEYKVVYGEFTTFKNHFDAYSCMEMVEELEDLGALPDADELRATPEEELRATNRG